MKEASITLKFTEKMMPSTNYKRWRIGVFVDGQRVDIFHGNCNLSKDGTEIIITSSDFRQDATKMKKVIIGINDSVFTDDGDILKTAQGEVYGGDIQRTRKVVFIPPLNAIED